MFIKLKLLNTRNKKHFLWSMTVIAMIAILSIVTVSCGDDEDGSSEANKTNPTSEPTSEPAADINKRLVRMEMGYGYPDEGSYYVYDYNLQGQIIKETFFDKTGAVNSIITYVYEDSKITAQKTVYSNAYVSREEAVFTLLDGRVIKEEWGVYTIDYEYDNDGHLISQNKTAPQNIHYETRYVWSNGNLIEERSEEYGTFTYSYTDKTSTPLPISIVDNAISLSMQGYFGKPVRNLPVSQKCDYKDGRECIYNFDYTFDEGTITKVVLRGKESNKGEVTYILSYVWDTIN